MNDISKPLNRLNLEMAMLIVLRASIFSFDIIIQNNLVFSQNASHFALFLTIEVCHAKMVLF